MRIIKTILIILFTSISLSVFTTSCIFSLNKAKELDRGENYIVYDIGNISELIASDVDIYVSVGGKSEELRLEADPEIIDDIDVEVKRGILSVNDRNNKSGKKGLPKAKAFITVVESQLRSIYATADAEVTLQEQLDAEIFAIDASVAVNPTAFD